MKVYVAGKTRGISNYPELFERAEKELQALGCVVINPSILPTGLDQGDYTKLGYAMMDVCEGIYLLNNWRDSVGAKLEHAYALKTNMWIKYQE